MMFNQNSKATRVLGNFDFHVAFVKGTKVQLQCGVEKISGLGAAGTNVIWYREAGLSTNAATPYAGLSQTEPVTFSQCALTDLKDAKAIRDWHQECKGEKGSGLGGYRKDIIITPQGRGPSGTDTFTSADLPKDRQIVLKDCICTKVSISDFDANSQGFLEVSFTVAFRDMEIVAP